MKVNMLELDKSLLGAHRKVWIIHNILVVLWYYATALDIDMNASEILITLQNYFVIII